MIDQRIEAIEHAIIAHLKHPLEMNLGMHGGLSGIGMFLFLIYRLDPTPERLSRIEETVTNGFEQLNSTELAPDFCNGISGFTYFLRFLGHHNILSTEDDPLKGYLDHLDAYLNNAFITKLNQENLDFLHGAEGILNYIITFKPESAIIPHFLHKLEELREKLPNGIAWKSNITLKNNVNEQVYNFGLAHGMPATLILLSKIVKTTHDSAIRKMAYEMIEQNCQFFLSNKLEVNEISVFPTYCNSTIKPGGSRLGWCYGDLGVILALWQGGEAINKTSIKEEAVDIALKSTQRKLIEETQLVDAGLCHGTAGVALIYKKLGALTGIQVFKDTAKYWLDQTLTTQNFEDGNAGYKMWTREGYRTSMDLLDGIAGIGSALIDSQLKQPTDWENVFLI